MKLKHVVATLAAMSVSAFGANITVTNNQGPVNTQSVVDNSGAAVEGGFAAIGTFDVAQLVTLSSGADLDAAFSIFDGASGSVGTQTIFNGVYNFSNNGSDIGATGFSGPIHLVIGNGADLASSTEAAILEIGSFPTSEPAVSTIFVNNASATPFLGDFDTFTLQPATVPRQNPALRLAAIPEPSSSLLIGLAGLSLLIRRRR
jgi:hypothetical protein